MVQETLWGILGCGRIARKLASDLRRVAGAKIFAVASRNEENAMQFANDFSAEKIYTSYEALAADENVQVIYIATPHNLHYENTLLCLEHGKAVLCEKPFAINSRQAAAMIAKAKEKNVFLMEALWTKFLPHYNKLQQLIREGLIGEIKSVSANFGFKPVEPIAQRIFDPALAGGTLLDIGIYNLFIALSILGKPQTIDAVMTPAHTGVDEQCAVTMQYNNGAIAQLFSTFTTNLATEADIRGTSGRIRLSHRFYAPEATIEYYPGWVESKQIIEVPKEEGWGYQYQAKHVQECLQHGLSESTVMTFADTMLLIETMDEIRRKAGIVYDADKC